MAWLLRIEYEGAVSSVAAGEDDKIFLFQGLTPYFQILVKHFPWLNRATSDEQFELMLSTLTCWACQDKMRGTCAGKGFRGPELRNCKLAIRPSYRPVSVDEWEKIYGVKYKPDG